MQRPGDQPPAASEKLVRTSSGDPERAHQPAAEAGMAVYGVERLLPTRPRCTLKRDLAFGNSTHVLS